MRIARKTGVCVHCKEKKVTEWANISGEYKAEDNNDWLELCKRCHFIYDNPNKKPPKNRGKAPPKPFRSSIPPYNWVYP